MNKNILTISRMSKIRIDLFRKDVELHLCKTYKRTLLRGQHAGKLGLSGRYGKETLEISG